MRGAIIEKIEYRGVEFNVVRTLSNNRTRVSDAAGNYLYHHVDYVGEVNFQPAMVSYVTDLNGNPVAVPGNLPGKTDLALLSWLMQPRGLLKMTGGGSVILETPAISPIDKLRMPCDCTNGPFCELVGTPVMVGLRHWVVQLHFTADVRDVTEPGEKEFKSGFDAAAYTNENAVLSNLWVGTEDVDFQHRSVRRFAGRAILRADVMRHASVGNNSFGRLGINANSFRDLYIFPCPNHYQRQNVSVEISDDGCTCNWSFEDVMRGYDLGLNSPILDIECFRTFYMKQGSAAKIAFDTLRGTLVEASTGLTGAVSAATNIAQRGLLSAIDNIPKYYQQCRCDLTADRNANLGDLSRIALGVVLNQSGISTLAQMLTGTSELVFRQDIADKVYTSAELTVHWTDEANFALAGLSFLSAPAAIAINALFGAPNQIIRQGGQAVIGKYTEDHQTLRTSPGMGPNLPIPDIVADRSGNPSYKRNPAMHLQAFGVTPNGDTSVQSMIVQALLGQNEAPPPVPDVLTQLS